MNVFVQRRDSVEHWNVERKTKEEYYVLPKSFYCELWTNASCATQTALLRIFRRLERIENVLSFHF